MMTFRNKPSDLKIRYGVNTYRKIENLFDIQVGELPILHFMLSLMGYQSGKKIELDDIDSKSDKTHEFSLRTFYPRNENDFDAYFGLLTILDNLDLPYETVINDLAFERTEKNNVSFTKMTNVKTFYEYMLAGIDFFENNFLLYGSDPVDVADSIHEFLTNDQSEIKEILAELLLQEAEE
ncbi:MAG TPA: hypothetical protein GX708_15850 [Gallicola sp.]|nr:hypothetical protein [Gallicola sp.]